MKETLTFHKHISDWVKHRLKRHSMTIELGLRQNVTHVVTINVNVISECSIV